MVVHGSGGNGCTAMPVSYLGNGLCTSQVLGRCQNSIADATSRGGPTIRSTLLGLFEGDTQVSSKTDNCVSLGAFPSSLCCLEYQRNYTKANLIQELSEKFSIQPWKFLVLTSAHSLKILNSTETQ